MTSIQYFNLFKDSLLTSICHIGFDLRIESSQAFYLPVFSAINSNKSVFCHSNQSKFWLRHYISTTQPFQFWEGFNFQTWATLQLTLTKYAVNVKSEARHVSYILISFNFGEFEFVIYSVLIMILFEWFITKFFVTFSICRFVDDQFYVRQIYIINIKHWIFELIFESPERHHHKGIKG